MKRVCKQMIQHVRRLGGLSLVVAGLLIGPGAPTAQARDLELDRLTPQQVNKMPREAQEEYEQALGYLDKVLYTQALPYLSAAVEKDPTNASLRLMTAQLAKYLGDTRWGEESAKYYDIVMENLKTLSDSNLLNVREQGRAKQELDKVAALQQSITERDAKRHEWGMAVAKMYMKELLQAQAKVEEAKDKAPGGHESLMNMLGAPTGPDGAQNIKETPTTNNSVIVSPETTTNYFGNTGTTSGR